MINSVWLTVNRFCNFRCQWCYAEGTCYSRSDDMPFAVAKKLVDFSKELGAANILLIGGEPTYYPRFFELLKHIKASGFECTLITNGYRFRDKSFVKKVQEAGLDSIGFSIKAVNRLQHRQLTGVDAFDDIKMAIKNLSKIDNIKIGYSTVVSNDTVDNLEEFAELLAGLDDKKWLRYVFCGPVFDKKSDVDKHCVPMQKEIVEKVVAKFDEIDSILGGRVMIEQSYPMCVWPVGFIDKLKERGQVDCGCHLQNRVGLVFDGKGRVLPCSLLTGFPIGQYGKDFSNKLDFEKFWMSENLQKLHNEIYAYPNLKCVSCPDYLECGGGCPLKWLIYDTKEIPGFNRDVI
ncbi:hypothetical protein FACS189481_4530 [Clostridia bacterium]|nr:hypothetical protein FACS189481_4530 [Clostridia bacterium]